MKRFYKNPNNGYIENDGSTFCPLFSFLFGGIYFALRGNWSWFFLWAMLLLVTCGAGLFIIPFFTRKINRTYLLRKGYIEVINVDK